MDQYHLEVEQGILAYKKVYAETRDMEAGLIHLRNLGLSRVQSMAVICRVHGIHLGDAKGIVVYSKAWEDLQEPFKRFEKSFFESLKKLADEDNNLDLHEDETSDEEQGSNP